MIKKTKKEEKSSKEDILKYLQANALDLRKLLPGLLDARFADEPARIVLEFHTVPENVEKFISKIDFSVEVVKSEKEAQVVEGNKNLDKWAERYPEATKTATAATNRTTEAINPNSKSSSIGAYEAWKKRHSAVKIK